MPWRQFPVTFERQCNEPPRVIVKGSIIVAFMEFMESKTEAAPENPPFQIGFRTLEYQVVADTEALSSKTNRPIKVQQKSLRSSAGQELKRLAKDLIGKVAVELMRKGMLEL